MTAEVAILNREAVALAADSAVTFMGPEGLKIYNTNKLFALSMTEPIAAMVYGAGSFGSVPWETVVKEYRRQLVPDSYGTVEEYASDLIKFLPSIVEPQEQYRRVFDTAKWELLNIRNSVKVALFEMNISAQPISRKAICDKIIAQIEARISQLRSDDTIEHLGEGAAGRQINSAIPDWDAFVNEHLDDLPSNGRIKQLSKAMIRASIKVASPFYSGVVVAGFGTRQMFPSLFHYVIDGVAGGKVRTRFMDGAKIGEVDQTGEELSATIFPFAQRDMAETFMNGIHPDYHLVLEDFVDETIGQFIEYSLDQVKGIISNTRHSNLLKDMSNRRSGIVQKFQDRLGDYLKVNYSGQIMTIVDLLPKEELAEMAETLVNLTSFMRRVTPEDETVGGPIDVAVISKGDGLVWIKRKHYFLPELNLRYLDRNQNLIHVEHTERSTSGSKR